MKKFLVSLTIFSFGMAASMAQEMVIGDMNGSGTLTIGDVTLLADAVLNGKVECHVCIPQPVYESVDLGLPSGTEWATCNVGAASPKDHGDYFAWGEIEPYDVNAKSVFNWATYKYCLGSETTITKYCTDSACGIVDDKTELGPEDDAASMLWGAEWGIPTNAQFTELRSSCTWNWNEADQGYDVVGPNGNSIFLPITGYVNETFNDTKVGNYWLRNAHNSKNATRFFFSESEITYSAIGRFYGRSIRPIRRGHEVYFVNKVTLDYADLALAKGKTKKLVTHLTPASCLVPSITWTSSDASIAKVDASGVVTAVKKGTATITATCTEGSGVKTSCIVYVEEPEYVDLGLPSKTLWATTNIGALKPEDAGDMFSWGEVVPYDNNGKTDFNWENYKYCDGSSTTMTKYCTQSAYGNVDSKTALANADDAAYVNWGSDWRMPTEANFKELVEKCTWTWVASKSGFKVVGPNGNSIFMPAVGYRVGSNRECYNQVGDYWTKTLSSSQSNYAVYLHFISTGKELRSGGLRKNGHPIRPVHIKL